MIYLGLDKPSRAYVAWGWKSGSPEINVWSCAPVQLSISSWLYVSVFDNAR